MNKNDTFINAITISTVSLHFIDPVKKITEFFFPFSSSRSILLPSQARHIGGKIIEFVWRKSDLIL